MSNWKTTHTRLMPRYSYFIALLLAGSSLLAQGKNMGQAGQYYKQTPPKKFKVIGPKKATKSDISWSVGKGGHPVFEKNEYAILEPEVVIDYQDVKIHADKVTLNFKTKDVVAQGHVIIDQGPNRITADHTVFNLDTKTGTLFNATGAMEPSLYFIGEKLEKLGDDRYRLTNGTFTSCDIDKP